MGPRIKITTENLGRTFLWNVTKGGTQAQYLWCMGLVALWHPNVESGGDRKTQDEAGTGR